MILGLTAAAAEANRCRICDTGSVEVAVPSDRARSACTDATASPSRNDSPAKSPPTS